MHKSSPLSVTSAPQGARQARRNLAKQTQQSKRAALVESTRVFSSKSSADLLAGGSFGLGKGTAASGGGAPRICAVIDLAGGVAWDSIKAFEEDSEEEGIKPVPGRSSEEARKRGDAFCEVEATRFRRTIQFLPLPYGALYATLDGCKCADFVLFILSSTRSIEPGSWGELCLRALQSQGLPTVLIAVPTLHPSGQTGAGGSKKAGPIQRIANETRKSLLSFSRYFAPEVEKVHALDDKAERSALIRTLATSTPRRVAWRDFRAWSVSEKAEWVASEADGSQGTLKVEGWIRGAPMSAQRLVHLPDFGDFPLRKITYAPPPRAARRTKDKTQNAPAAAAMKDVEMANGDASEAASEQPLEQGDVLEERAEECADEMRSTNDVDELANEQTWPTEEEEAEGAARAAQGEAADIPPPAAIGTTPKSIAPKTQKKTKGDGGLSEKWKAAWIIESDEEESDEEEDDEEGRDVDEDMKPESQAQDDAMSEAAMDEMEDEDYDEAEERAAWEAYQERRHREKEEREEADFPDEVDTPMEIPARQRFARYRGLKSFRTSPWDPYEDLPTDYAKIFQFDSYLRTKRRVEASALMEGVQPGTRVCLWIENVPKAAAQRARAEGVGALPELQEGDIAPFVVFGLLRHEHKKSVLNFTIARNTEYEEPVRSKVSEMFHFSARPAY